MGRPSLTETRTEEILEAFERCVGRYGLEGSSLERIADEAGVKRSILRHYVGNRDDLILALADRVVAKYRRYLEESFATITDKNRIDQMIRLMLPTQAQATGESLMVIEALIAAGEKHDAVRTQMLDYIEHVVVVVSGQLQLEFPEQPCSRCWSVAYGVVCVWFNQESMAPLGLPSRFLKSARASIRELIETLGA